MRHSGENSVAGSPEDHPRSGLWMRIVLVGVSLAVAGLLAEGVVSLVFGRSIRGLVQGWPAPVSIPTLTDRDLHASAARESGLYRVHPDPRVGYTPRVNAELRILDSVAHTDHLGMRVRVGVPAPEDAIRLVVLGDSVAFGFGVNDDQTLAHHLEQLLRHVRGDRECPVCCRTVATPGWNHRNAVSFLLDHLPEYDPHIVVYHPVGNDLADTDSVWTGGHRRAAPDPASGDPWLPVSVNDGYVFICCLGQRLLRKGIKLSGVNLGVSALHSDLSRESRRRYDANAASILRLARVLRKRNARLMLLQGRPEAYCWMLWDRVLAAGLDIPIVPLENKRHQHLCLANDPHANPRGLRVLATWVAGALLDEGWISRGMDRPLPPAPSDVERAARLSPDQFRARAREARARARQKITPVVDMDTGQGAFQILGGLLADGTVGTRALLMLAPENPCLRVELAPLPDRPDLYPLNVAVEVDGVALGSITVRAGDESTRATFVWPLPEPCGSSGEAIEVVLKPARWVVVHRDGRSCLASVRLVRVGVVRT